VKAGVLHHLDLERTRKIDKQIACHHW